MPRTSAVGTVRMITGGLISHKPNFEVIKAGQIFRPDTGKLMMPGAQIMWEMHLHAMGERVPETQVEIGVWYHDEPPAHRTILSMLDAQGPNSLDIPPNGNREVLAFVDNFQWNWQINYVFDEDAAPLVPAGTMIITRAWHDNTTANPNNPDPNQWVGWGDRTVDEMAHNWVDVTYLGQEEYERLVAERNAQLSRQQSGSE